MSRAIGEALHKRTLQLIILPTEKCNFRCTYCYETFEVGKMKKPIVNAVKELIRARVEGGTLDLLNLTWFGGEPLLASEVVLDISSFANELHSSGALKEYVGDITTNGYLLKEDLLRKLVAQKQKLFQISLDGYGAGHDVTRQYASGKGTFDTIWANLLAAKRTDLDFKITIRCHLTKDNTESTEELVRQISVEFGGDRRFSVFFKPIENLGGPKAKGIVTVERNSAYERVRSLEQPLKAVGLQTSACVEGPESYTGGGQDTVGPGTVIEKAEAQSAPVSEYAQRLASFKGYVCYAARPNSLMIRADGSIGKCTVLLHEPRNRVGQINPDGTVTLDAALVSNVWMRGFRSLDVNELGCPAKNLGKLPKEVPIKPLRELVPA